MDNYKRSTGTNRRAEHRFIIYSHVSSETVRGMCGRAEGLLDECCVVGALLGSKNFTTDISIISDHRRHDINRPACTIM